MLDVHPPHHAASTRRDFVIHIATIVIGLLIAVCLEQTVEIIHRHTERENLRAALTRESQQIQRDTTAAESALVPQIEYLKLYEQQMSDAVRNHHSFVPPPLPQESSGYELADEPVYKAAKASGKLSLLTDDEIVAYGEMDLMMSQVALKFADVEQAEDKADAHFSTAAFGQDPATDPVTTATPELLRQFYADLVPLQTARTHLLRVSRGARGAATALLQGERDLHKIQQAEHQFDK